ncbi:hypothetical protein KSF78_0008481 [Schistosoma japonicum]|nr:hypothetical protein KSF78_0008481 [Schistosoma japonicum]
MIERFRKFYIEYLDYLDVNKNKNSFEELENLIDKYGVKYLQCPKDKCKELKTSIPQVINDTLTSIATMLKIPNNLNYTKSKENETQY